MQCFLMGMRNPEFGMQWFGVSGNIWMVRQDCDFEYCSACFWLQSPISSHPLTMKIPLPMTQGGNPPSSGLRDLFHSSCGRGVGRTYMCHNKATEPKEQLLCTHLPWGHERAVIYLPASVEKSMYQPGTVSLSYFPALLWKLFPSPSLSLAFSSLQLGCAGCEATVSSPWKWTRCLNRQEVFRSPAGEGSLHPMPIWIPNMCNATAGTWPVLNPNVQIRFLL